MKVTKKRPKHGGTKCDQVASNLPSAFNLCVVV